jgi:signal transduction histidine kinase/ligand-binding sensor domain-containing protein
LFLTLASLSLVPSASAVEPSSTFSDYVQTTWTHRDGLLSTFIRSIVQSADGYIWLGSTDGLFRFDGVRFVQWRAKTGDLRRLGVVNALCAAHDGSLWLGTESGIVGLIRGESLSSSNAGAPVRAVLEAGDGTVWAATGDRLLRYSGNPGAAAPTESPLATPFISGPLQDRTGSIWLSTEDGVEEIKPGGDPRVRRALSGRFWLSQDGNGTIWTTSEDGATEPVAASAPVRRRAGRLEVRTTFHDSRGTTWIGTLGKGLFRVSHQAGQQRAEFAGLRGDSIWSVFEDREQNLWVGTQNGLHRFRDGRIKALAIPESWAGNDIAALASGTDGSVWAATSQGIARIDGDHRELLAGGTPATAVSVDHQNRLWAGTGKGVVTLINGRREALPWPAAEQLANITAIAIDGRGGVWLSDATRGLFRWADGRADDFSSEPLLRGRTVLAAQADAKGRVWFGLYEGGIVIFENGRFRTAAAPDGALDGPVTSILADDDGVTWVGSDAGLRRFDGSNVVTWTTTDGLPGNRVQWILDDRAGELWLGFSFGIAHVSRNELDATGPNRSRPIQYELLDSGDGLRGNPDREWQAAAIRASDGRLWFRTSDGVSIVDPRRLEKNPILPPVHIESMSADGVRVDPARRIQLAPRTRDIQFDYTALSLVEPRQVRFRYMLEGYDSGWQDAGARRQAFYTNLPPRRYRFRVLACNNDGVWNEEGTSQEFVLLPAFYQTSWFGVLVLLVVATGSWGAYRLRVRQLTSRMRMLFEERLAERTRIARDLHDNLLQSILGISLQIEVTDELLPADAQARQPLERALQLSKGAMAEGRRALNDLRTRELPTGALVHAFSQVVKELPVADPPEVQILAEGEERPLSGIAGDDVLQIGRQAIANALQHARARRIQVVLSYSPHSLRVVVKDNGRGIDENTLHEGKPDHHGIGGMRERAERIGATLSILSRVGEGTEVSLNVPGHIVYAAGDRH